MGHFDEDSIFSKTTPMRVGLGLVEAPGNNDRTCIQTSNGRRGADVYLVEHKRRALYWRIALDADGTISMAGFGPGL
jgi:hypothetical protein